MGPFIELVAQRHPPKPPAGMQPPENAKDWFRIENNADDADATDVLIYSSIGGWFGMWADDFVDELKAVTTSKINVRLNSPGGSVFDGIAIANAIRSHPATVTVYVDSLAASIASVIAMSGDRLVMMPQSQIMVHNASGACYGDASEMTKMADLLDKQSRNIAEAYAQHTGRPLAEWQQYMSDETWFTAEEAVAVGLADEVVPMKKAEPAEDETVDAAMKRSWDLSMYLHAGRDAAPAPKIVAQAQPKVDVVLGDRVLAANVAAGIIDGITNSAEPQKETPVAAETTTMTIQLTFNGDNFAAQLDELFARLEKLRPVQAADSPPEPPNPEDASTPPPDEDEEEEEEEGPPFEEDPDNQADAEVGDAPPEAELDETVEAIETYDEADEWSSIVGSFISPTSPCADDVFAQLKEGW